MAFEQLQQLVTEANTEQAELDAANQVLDQAKADLFAVQTQVADKQAAVDQALANTNQEKSDVVSKIQALVTRCNEILTELQG